VRGGRGVAGRGLSSEPGHDAHAAGSEVRLMSVSGQAVVNAHGCRSALGCGVGVRCCGDRGEGDGDGDGDGQGGGQGGRPSQWLLQTPRTETTSRRGYVELSRAKQPARLCQRVRRQGLPAASNTTREHTRRTPWAMGYRPWSHRPPWSLSVCAHAATIDHHLFVMLL
jgi:hypothetical protein